MTARRLGIYTDGSQAWYAARARRLGGSDIGAMMGWSPWTTRDQLLQEKAGAAERTETAAMTRGKLCEPAVIAFLCHKHGLDVDPQAIGTWQHPDIDWAIYNADGISRDNVLLEAKTASDRATEYGWGRAGTDKIPATYLAQVTWGMGILGIKECRVGLLHGAVNGKPNLGFASYRVRFDADLFDMLLTAGHAFMADLEQLTNTTEKETKA